MKSLVSAVPEWLLLARIASSLRDERLRAASNDAAQLNALVRIHELDDSPIRKSNNRASEAANSGPSSYLDLTPARMRASLMAWRRGEPDGSIQLDPLLREVGRAFPEFDDWILGTTHATADRHAVAHRVEPPLRLAVAAARVILDPRMPVAMRAQTRSILLRPRQQRYWTKMQPLVDEIYLYALRHLWSHLAPEWAEVQRARDTLARLELRDDAERPAAE
jgi:hypothetical protein